MLLSHDSAAGIPSVVERAERCLTSDFIIRPRLTTFIGHSHGAHVAANIVFDFGEDDPIARFVGLDTSTDGFGVHDLNRDWEHFTFESYGPDRWRGAITACCRQVEFYKTS